MKSFFDSLETFEQIKQIMEQSSSEDGENLTFELKGLHGKTVIDKDFKDILAKEICAFSNSYGGILCLHFGEDTNILKIEKKDSAKIYQTLESWLRDSIEPRLLGIDLKFADGLIIINIPASINKPHRTATKSKTYYYRHATQSEPMPEIMISSMYRSQDYLITNSKILLHKTPNQLSFTIKLNNLSNISGSKPKIQLQIYSNDLNKGKNSMKWQEHIYIDKKGLYSFTPIDEILPIISIINSSNDFANQILYPLDSVHISNYSVPFENLDLLKYLIVHLDYYFIEAAKVSKTVLFKVDDNKIINLMDTDKNTKQDILNEYYKHNIK